MYSNKIIRRSLLEHENKRLENEYSVLTERFKAVRRRVSLTAIEDNSDEVLKNVQKKLLIYENEYEKLNKTVQNLNIKKSALVIEKKIEKQEELAKALEKENIRLNRFISSKPQERPERSSDPYTELTLLQSLVQKLESSSQETQKSIQSKSLRCQELSQEYELLKSSCPKTHKKNFSSVSKARDYLKSLKNSLSSTISKSLKTISDLESVLLELKSQETILKSTLIKREQQYRLIETLGKSCITENQDESFVPDVKFFYRPTIKYLYI